MVVVLWSECERGQSDLGIIVPYHISMWYVGSITCTHCVPSTVLYMVFKEGGQRERERETKRGFKRWLKDGFFGTRDIHAVEG